jgi:hypothetical protein
LKLPVTSLVRVVADGLQPPAPFGDALDWQRLEDRRACRIRKPITVGGWRDDPEKWPEVYAEMVDAMIRLEKALRPQVQKLKV